MISNPISILHDLNDFAHELKLMCGFQIPPGLPDKDPQWYEFKS